MKAWIERLRARRTRAARADLAFAEAMLGPVHLLTIEARERLEKLK